METGKLFKKCLAIGVIILFFSITTVSSVGVSFVTTTMNQSSLDDTPIPILEGIGGNNDWYISDVFVSFSFDPKFVQEIHYTLDGTNWNEYYTAFIIDDEGEISIGWYWIDTIEGHIHYELPIIFKIDKSTPTVNLNKEVQINSKVKFTASCNDDISGDERVEFYLDDELITTSSEKPHEYLYSPDGSGPHDVYAIGYDNAGLSEQSETLDTKEKSRSLTYPILNNFFQRIYYLINLIQQIFLI